MEKTPWPSRTTRGHLESSFFDAQRKRQTAQNNTGDATVENMQ
jgi:hypothetical protein